MKQDKTSVPPLNHESRLNKITDLVLSQVEKQLKDGTVSSQIATFFLNHDLEKKTLELERLRLENDHLRAKIKSEESKQNLEDQINEVMEALKSYTVQPNDLY